jgi:hypothetical protein
MDEDNLRLGLTKLFGTFLEVSTFLNADNSSFFVISSIVCFSLIFECILIGVNSGINPTSFSLLILISWTHFLQCTQQYKNHHRTGKEKHVQKKIAT